MRISVLAGSCFFGFFAIACAEAEQLQGLGDAGAYISAAGFMSGPGQGGAPFGSGGAYGSGGFGSGGIPVGPGGTPGAGGAPACPSGQKQCQGACVAKTPANGCGSDCTACPAAPSHATPKCENDTCKYTCDTGYTQTGDACVADAACTDKQKNGTETDVDCGGGKCPKCDPGLVCTADADCAKGPCESGKCGCTAATCATLTGCPAAADDGCGKTLDCSTACTSPAVCVAEKCCTPACPAKACGKMADDGCGGMIDCTGKCATTDVCDQDQCCTPQGCGTRCGPQTDCGKTLDCGKCDGSPCVAGPECASKACEAGMCVSCKDGKKNNGETDVDCGGANCGKCAKGKKCTVAADCTTGTCCPAPNLNCFLQADGTCQ